MSENTFIKEETTMKNTNNNQKVLKGQITIDSILPKEKTVRKITSNYIQKQLSIKFKEELEQQYADIINNIKTTPLNHDRFKYFITAPEEITLIPFSFSEEITRTLSFSPYSFSPTYHIDYIDVPCVQKCLYLFDTNSQKWRKLAPYDAWLEGYITSHHEPPVDKITINNRTYFITNQTFGNNTTSPSQIDAQKIFQTLAKKQIDDFLNRHKKYYFPRAAKAVSKLTQREIDQLKAII